MILFDVRKVVFKIRRERKKELNRQKIIAAAKKLFLRKGISATNVRDIRNCQIFCVNRSFS